MGDQRTKKMKENQQGDNHTQPTHSRKQKTQRKHKKGKQQQKKASRREQKKNNKKTLGAPFIRVLAEGRKNNFTEILVEVLPKCCQIQHI